ncbi:TIGR01244 family sulfur transferase [Paracoccus zhejiangensis]|uniref:TIGR01244 family phosphatase n=1 Tax=Paracoccus zhejiangensis TaxID=1077935 RepID=A0A2H5EW79_9RHOB|nr:TIGR01244 family sulfur transferase [Paracoccus zhejiangensis]AUH63534.1 TIGR01244 family phosphatase [Paracoccus zhejiangensis]
MDLRQLIPDLAVSGQITPQDVAALAEAGFKVLINNRPDEEIGPEEDSSVMAEAARAAGMSYHYIPFVPSQITPEMITGFAEAMAERGPHFAYCRSGNRSTVLWALTQASKRPHDEILQIAANAGYDLSGIRPMLASLASRRG